MSKPVPAIYLVHHQNLSRRGCTWMKQYYELTLEGRLSSVTVYEDGTTLAYAHPVLFLCGELCSRAQYRAAKLLHTQYLRRRHREERAKQDAAKLLRSGMSRHEHASREAGATVASTEPLVVPAQPALVTELPVDLLADYTVFDCETTGFSHEKDHLLELAATRYTNGVPVDSMQSFVRFTGWIPPKITELTGITTKEVFRAPEVRDVLVEFKRIAGDSLLVGHNVAFDLRFVNAARARLGASAPLPNRFLCTQVVATSRYPDISHKLGELCKRFNINTSGAHRAGNDVVMTAKLLQYLHAQQPIAPHLIGASSAPKPKAKQQQPALFA